MRNWLGRIAFALLVLAFVLAWEGYQASTGERGPVSQYRVALYYVGAAVLGALGLAGVRQRHHPR